MRKTVLTGLVCGALAGCAPPYGAPYPGAPYGAAPYPGPPPYGAPVGAGGTLQGARQACTDAYPAKIGNYLPHAECVNAAVERYAMASEPHPDLVRVQERARTTLSQKIDQRQLSIRAGEQKMSEADRLVSAARRERDAGNAAAADRNLAQVEALLQ